MSNCMQVHAIEHRGRTDMCADLHPSMGIYGADATLQACTQRYIGNRRRDSRLNEFTASGDIASLLYHHATFCVHYSPARALLDVGNAPHASNPAGSTECAVGAWRACKDVLGHDEEARLMLFSARGNFAKVPAHVTHEVADVEAHAEPV